MQRVCSLVALLCMLDCSLAPFPGKAFVAPMMNGVGLAPGQEHGLLDNVPILGPSIGAVRTTLDPVRNAVDIVTEGFDCITGGWSSMILNTCVYWSALAIPEVAIADIALGISDGTGGVLTTTQSYLTDKLFEMTGHNPETNVTMLKPNVIPCACAFEGKTRDVVWKMSYSCMVDTIPSLNATLEEEFGCFCMVADEVHNSPRCKLLEGESYDSEIGAQFDDSSTA